MRTACLTITVLSFLFCAASASAATLSIDLAATELDAGQEQRWQINLTGADTPGRVEVRLYRVFRHPDTGEMLVMRPEGAPHRFQVDRDGRFAGEHVSEHPGSYLITAAYYTHGPAPDRTAEAGWVVRDTAQRQTTTTLPPTGARERARLKLTARIGRVRAGKRFAVKLTVRNTSADPARNVTVCQRVPSHTRLVSASRRPVRMRGAVACARIGTIRARRARAVTFTFRAGKRLRARRVIVSASASADNANPAKTRKSARARR